MSTKTDDLGKHYSTEIRRLHEAGLGSRRIALYLQTVERYQVSHLTVSRWINDNLAIDDQESE